MSVEYYKREEFTLRILFAAQSFKLDAMFDHLHNRIIL